MSKVRLALIGEKAAIASLFRQSAGNRRIAVSAVFSDGLSDKEATRYPRARVLPGSDVNSAAGRMVIEQSGAQWLVSVCNYEYLIRRSTLDLFSGRTINLHFGQLPHYAGRHGYQWAIRNGEIATAVTLHQMTFPFDSGQIAAVREVPIGPSDTGLVVYRRCLKEGISLLADFLEGISGGEVPSWLPQAAGRRAYLASDVGDGRIDWSKPVHEITNFVRAANFLPFDSPSYTAWSHCDAGVRRVIYEIRAVDVRGCNHAPGEFWEEGERLLARAGDGVAEITKFRVVPSHTGEPQNE